MLKKGHVWIAAVLAVVIVGSEIGNYVLAKKLSDAVKAEGSELAEVSNVHCSWTPFNPGVTFDMAGLVTKELLSPQQAKMLGSLGVKFPGSVKFSEVELRPAGGFWDRLMVYFRKPKFGRVTVHRFEWADANGNALDVKADSAGAVVGLDRNLEVRDIFVDNMHGDIKMVSLRGPSAEFEPLVDIKRLHIEDKGTKIKKKHFGKLPMELFDTTIGWELEGFVYHGDTEKDNVTLDRLRFDFVVKDAPSQKLLGLGQQVYVQLSKVARSTATMNKVDMEIGGAPVQGSVRLDMSKEPFGYRVALKEYDAEQLAEGLVKAGWMEPQMKPKVAKFLHDNYMQEPIHGLWLEGGDSRLMLNGRETSFERIVAAFR